MPETIASTAAATLAPQECAELANQLFREYHTRCFWHCPRDLVITQDLIPLVVNGLRKNGGRRGFILAEKLLSRDVAQRPDAGELDWANDSAFRFFPVQPDEDFGYCLHPADLAVNKLLALAGRSEFRDFLDVIYFDGTYLSVGAMAWAACGKDGGYTPALLVDLANRHTCFQDSDLQGENLARPLDLRELKKQWLEMRERAEKLFDRLPAQDLGCLYLDAENKPVTPDADHPEFPGLKHHRGSIRGAWPRMS